MPLDGRLYAKQIETDNLLEGDITAEKALDLAIRQGVKDGKPLQDAVAEISQIEGLNFNKALLNIFGQGDGKDNEQVFFNTINSVEQRERRMREIIPEMQSKDGILERIINAKEGESLELSNDIPEDVREILSKYSNAGLIHLGLLTDSNKPEGVTSIVKTSEGGIYKKLVNDALGSLKYFVRKVGEFSTQLQKADPEHEALHENIGNVPAAGWKQETFMVKAFLDNFFDYEELGESSSHLSKLREHIGTADPSDVHKTYTESLISNFQNKMLGYPPTGGSTKMVDMAMKLSKKHAEKVGGETTLKPEDIIATSGAAHGIFNMRIACSNRRILHTLPSYPPLFELEEMMTKMRDPKAEMLGSNIIPDIEKNKWKPNVNEIREMVSDPENNIGVISIINPGNPTGDVWSKEDMLEVFEIAKENGCIIECDETYWQLVRPGEEFVSAAVLSAETGVPSVIYRSGSKDAMHCGMKIGWMEFHNPQNDPRVNELRDACFKIQMEMVGATAPDQFILPDIYLSDEWEGFIEAFNKELFQTADEVASYFENIPGVNCIPSRGAMYSTILIEDGFLNNKQSLDIQSDKIKNATEEIVSDPECSNEERLIAYIMASTGVEFVPLKRGFSGSIEGFRACNLTKDPEERARRYNMVADALTKYLDSHQGDTEYEESHSMGTGNQRMAALTGTDSVE